MADLFRRVLVAFCCSLESGPVYMTSPWTHWVLRNWEPLSSTLSDCMGTGLREERREGEGRRERGRERGGGREGKGKKEVKVRQEGRGCESVLRETVAQYSFLHR